MTTNESREFAQFCAAMRARSSDPDLDSATVRDILETAHTATKEPEDVTYQEVDAGGVEALWCVPADSRPRTVLLHSHMDGSVVNSMHSDRKAAAHIARPPVHCRWWSTTGVRLSTSSPRRSKMLRKPTIGCLAGATVPRTSPVSGTRSAATSPSVWPYGCVTGAPRYPPRFLSISPWCDLTLATASIDTNADVDMALSRGTLEFFRSAWLDGTGVDWCDPRVNLLEADLRGLLPISVFYGSDDLLADEAVELALRAKAAGNDQQLSSIQGGQHSFIMGAGRVPEVDDAITEMGEWLRRKLRLNEAA